MSLLLMIVFLSILCHSSKKKIFKATKIRILMTMSSRTYSNIVIKNYYYNVVSEHIMRALCMRGCSVSELKSLLINAIFILFILICHAGRLLWCDKLLTELCDVIFYCLANNFLLLHIESNRIDSRKISTHFFSIIHWLKNCVICKSHKLF